MPIRLIEPVEYTSNLEELLNLPKYEMGSDYQLSPELISSPSLENRIQPGTTPSTGYPDRYPKVDMPESELLNQYKGLPSAADLQRIYFMNRRKQQMQQTIQQAEVAKQKAAAADAAAKRQAPLQALVTAQANREARERVSQGEARDYGKTETRASSGWESSPFAKGGLVDFYRYGGFIG